MDWLRACPAKTSINIVAATSRNALFMELFGQGAISRYKTSFDSRNQKNRSLGYFALYAATVRFACQIVAGMRKPLPQLTCTERVFLGT